jgi:protein-arginine kinase activator protein McsA
MSSSCIEDLGKLVDKLITFVLFLATLELNIVDKEKKTGCNSCGMTYQSSDDQSFPNATHHLFPK